jgi:ureidoacrylate peracid hydrolase
MRDEFISTLAEKVDPSHAAVVVIDVQNDFCAEGGWFHREGVELSRIQAMVPRLENFLEKSREARVPVIFVRSFYDECYLSPPMRERRARIEKDHDKCLRGSWGAEFYRVQPRPEELVITKHRNNPFLGTELDQVLRSWGVKTLLLTGVATNVCVEATASHAYMVGYYVVLVEDCADARTAAWHEAAVDKINRLFGVAAKTGEITSAWRELRAPIVGTKAIG